MTIIEDRLNQPITLAKGSHRPDEGEMCLLEAAAWIAGEPWSDHPQCVCPVLAAFGRSWNDGITDDDRRTELLAPFIPRLVGTRSTPEVEERRSWMPTDWLVRTYTPKWLRLAGLESYAVAMEAGPEIIDTETCRQGAAAWDAARAAAGDAARDAAWDAARAAAGDAAWAAAMAAAGDAAWDAAMAAAWAASWDAARDAAWAAAGDAARAAAWAAARAAARDAAWAAARAAARDALEPTVIELQQSAVELFDQMIEAS